MLTQLGSLTTGSRGHSCRSLAFGYIPERDFHSHSKQKLFCHSSIIQLCSFIGLLLVL